MLKRMLGVGLIEVLVAIALAAMGLVALAAMQATSLRQAKQTQLRAVAALLAGDISERMRANLKAAYVPAGAAASGSGYAVTDKFSSQAQLPAAPAKACDTAALTCSAAELAAADLSEWRQLVRDQLPEGAVYLAPDTTLGGAYDLWLAWREPGSPDAAVLTGGNKECSPDLQVVQDATIRCLFFRVQL